MFIKIKTLLRGLQLRWKLFLVVVPLVIFPVLLTGSFVGYLSSQLAYKGITNTSKADLDHMASFTVDLLNAHYQQFQVYRRDKRTSFENDLSSLTNAAYGIIETTYHHSSESGLSIATAQQDVREALHRINVGESGYVFVVDGAGTLKVHIASEGKNILDEQDEQGRLFIREIIDTAKRSASSEINFITYPWKNSLIGQGEVRLKIAAYRYFPEWDWIVAVSGYLDETYEDLTFEQQAFAKLKEKIKQKRVGTTGYIYCMDAGGTFTLHPEEEGSNFIDARDSDGNEFIREMVTQKSGWIRYPWQNESDPSPRMKIVRYLHFDALDWIIAVGSYEDEFYGEANQIEGRTFTGMLLLTIPITLVAMVLVFWASRLLIRPIGKMNAAIKKVKNGDYSVTIENHRRDELGDLAEAFNKMIGVINKNRKMEMRLAHQEKMASLGVLSSGVAHEINNPLGVILGYARYLEGKIPADTVQHQYICEITRESKRCKKIVQDLLSYARMPRPTYQQEDINNLLRQIIAFTSNHTDIGEIHFSLELEDDLPQISIDGDLFRQIAINLILNAGHAMDGSGELRVKSWRQDESICIEFIDSGCGISTEDLEMVFEPFFTTKGLGTGLGLAITKQIIEMHQGTITMNSQLNHGTVVRITLPIAERGLII